VAAAGGCQGFTTVAIGRHVRNGSTGWSCFFQRNVGIANPNTIAAQVYCCN